MSKAEEIAQISMGRPHVVLLGAGASRAAFPNGEGSGLRLPLMTDFAEIVPVTNLLDHSGIQWRGRNFEDVFTAIANDAKTAGLKREIEDAVFLYFSQMRLPDSVTLYDHLVLSLRDKDVIATFNWDPFLILAAKRNGHISKPPNLLFLHGNVQSGYCTQDRVHGEIGRRSSRCGAPFHRVPLLYPLGSKNYSQNPAIESAWRRVQWAFENAFMVTVFGYSAPKTDEEARRLLHTAWGEPHKRNLEQFEFIDVTPEDVLIENWTEFVDPGDHHFEVHNTYFDSWLSKHPRRSGEAYWNQYMEALFLEGNPIPKASELEDLWEWYKHLVNAEAAASG
jgi:hypothetical protein